jgi:hypothetical protein
MHPVRRNLQSAADAGRVRPCLEQLRLDAGLPEQDRGDRAGNAGTDDEGFAGAFGHVLLLMPQGVKNVRRLIILATKISSN